MTRQDHEPPSATHRWGWRYHHTGIPTQQRRDGERYLPQFKMYVSGVPDSPYGVEWMRFEADSPISELVKTVPHVAFEVDDIDEALKGNRLLIYLGCQDVGPTWMKKMPNKAFQPMPRTAWLKADVGPRRVPRRRR